MFPQMAPGIAEYLVQFAALKFLFISSIKGKVGLKADVSDWSSVGSDR